MKNNFKIQEEKITKNIVIISIICAAILVISITAYIIYKGNNSNERQNEEIVEIGMKENNESKEEVESTSTQIGNKVDETNIINNTQENKNTLGNNTAKVENQNISITNSTTKNTSTNTTTSTNSIKKDEKESNNIVANEVKSEETNENKEAETKFVTPVKGEIIREYAKESLVYSETLQEWITHNGVDIKADKTTVVTSCAKGTVYAIKNDPRYGLTVIINHDNGFKSVYSNLLTAEFVVENEEVEAGQTIGTVGNSATFEISDDYHLHFELMQNDEYVDPSIYINF